MTLIVPIGQQLKHALRGLARAPMFAAVTVLTIGLGIGANTAIFSVLNGILLKALPYPEPERLVSVWQSAPKLVGMKEFPLSPSDYFVFQEESRTFRDFGLWTGGMESITGLSAPEEVRSITVTEGTLPALGIQPAMGRWFNQRDVAPGAPETILLTYGYWQRKLGSDPAAVGKRILVNGTAKEIIGIMPQRFRFLNEKPDIIQAFRFDRNKTTLGNFSFRSIARLQPGTTLAQANADVSRMIPSVNAKFPAPPGFSAKIFEEAGIRADVRPLKQDLVGSLSKVLWVLMGSLGVVLLIACANVANLLLVRAEARQHELAIRAAIGADSVQIAVELLIESLLLGLLGGIAGLGLAYGALRLLVSLAPAFLPRVENIALDPAALLFTLTISLFAGMLFGFIPVIKHAAPDVTTSLRAGGRTLSQSREAHRARNALVVVQVALAVVLLTGSGLMIRTFLALRRVQPGFEDAAHLQTLRVFIPPAQVKDPVLTLRMMQEMQRRIAEIPEVSTVAFANSIPTDGQDSTDLLYAEDHVYREGQIPPLRRFKFVTPGYFQALGTKLIAGRDYTWNDLDNRRLVVIVSENLARETWHDPRAALGKRIREGMKDPWREIIGVVQDVHIDGPDQKAPTTVYWPLMMENFWGQNLFFQRGVVYTVRSSRAGSESFVKQLQQTIWSVNSNLPLARIRTLEEAYSNSMARSSFTLVLLALAGGMALALGIVGIYGVISYSVSQRKRELGIRIALGASKGTVRGMVVRSGLMLTSAGMLVGLACAAALTRIMTSMLFGISPFDPITYLSVSAALLVSSGIASYLPAHRASSVSPMEAIHAD